MGGSAAVGVCVDCSVRICRFQCDTRGDGVVCILADGIPLALVPGGALEELLQ